MPPNNQGNATPFYNQDDNGDKPAQDGVSTAAEFDPTPNNGSRIWTTVTFPSPASAMMVSSRTFCQCSISCNSARLPAPAKDSQGGYNLHLMALQIPFEESAATSRLSAFMPRRAVKRFL